MKENSLVLQTDDPDFRKGFRLFNDRQFFEAHEAWELLWRRTKPGPEREAYQGLIQIAAACHHLLKENLTGAEGCLKNAHGHLDPYLARISQLDLSSFLQAAEQAVARKDPDLLPKVIPITPR